MQQELKISLINKRGRIIWVSQRDLKQSLVLGMRIFPNPKEEYYPELDQEFISLKDQPSIPSTETSEKLEVIAI